MLKKSLVIGAAHFLGSHLTKRLLRLGFSVTALIDKNDSIWRLADVIDGLDVRRVNFFSLPDVVKFIRYYKYEHIFYVSTYGEKEYQRDSDLIYYLNYSLMKDILADIIDLEFESFTYIGSYLEKALLPVFNSTDPSLIYDSSQYEYRHAKSMATNHIISEAINTGLPLYSIRPYFVYGPYFSSKTSFGTFVLNAALRDRLSLNHDFSNKDFVHVRDFMTFVITIAMQRPRNKIVFDCGSGEIFEMSRLLQVTKDCLPKVYEVNLVDKSQYQLDPQKILKADLMNIKDFCGWEPTISSHEGMRDLFNWSYKNLVLYRDFFQEESDKKNKYHFPWITV